VTPRRHTNFYIYSLVNYPKSATWTLGGSFDHLQDRLIDLDLDRFNPKVGLTWNPLPDTTVRVALFRVVNRSLISGQTLEPTQISGFNQFFDDANGTISWRYGIGIDQKFSSSFYGGLEMSERDMEVSRFNTTTNKADDFDWGEQLGRLYLYFTPQDWLALSSEYLFERFDRDPQFTSDEDIAEIKTHRFPFGIRFFHSLGLSAQLKATYVDHKGEFGNATFGVEPGRDRFWIVDTSIGYRLPKRLGILTIEVRNLFDEEIKFQDMDSSDPRIHPERLIYAKFTLAL
jgi:outer membrane receptor protein involved in Fe transport